MARNAKYTYDCPREVCGGKCSRGEQVVWTYGKTVTVSPCSALKAQGWNNKIQMAFHLSDEEAFVAQYKGIAL